MATSIPHQGGLTPSTSGQGQSGQAGQGSTSATGLVDKLAQNAEQTAAKAIDRVKESRGRAEQGIEQQHQKITSRIRGLGDALRSSSESLEDNEQVSALLNIASEQVDRVAQYVDNATPRSVARDIERFAREKPAWFFGGAFLAGLALGRFAKSSADSSYNDGMRFSEDDDLTGRYPQARGGAGATYANQSPYQRTSGQSSGYSGSQQGASYSGYTSSGSATSSGPYTGSGTSGSTSGTSGGTTQRMGSSYPSGATSSGYTGGAATSGTPSTTSPVSGSSGYSTGPSGGSYSGTSSTGSAANPSSTSTTQSTPPGSSQSATRTPNNGGSSGASKS